MAGTATAARRTPAIKRATQDQLRQIYLRQQQAGYMTTTAEQRLLRAAFLHSVVASRPANIPSLRYDLSNPAAQSFTLDTELLRNYNIEKFLKDFIKLAPRATAGLRANMDVVDFNNPEKLYNPIFLAMLLEAECRFVKGIHAEKKAMLERMDLEAKAAEVIEALGTETVDAVLEVFGKGNLVEVLELLKEAPLRIIGKEVRPHTEHMMELEARIMAANGIRVITAENFNDTSNIYLASFLCYLLGSDGGTFYTPSHSPVYVLGRKVLAPDGAQLAPVQYDEFVHHLQAIDQSARESGYTIRIAERDNPFILNTLSDVRAAKLFSRALSPSQKVRGEINKAAERGFRIILNGLSGAAYRTLSALYKQWGIDESVFQPLLVEENPYFEAGYTVTVKENAAGEITEYVPTHMGEDTTVKDVVRLIPYREYLANAQPGTLVYECDPDNDRFVVKQVLTKSSLALCKAFGIDTYDLGNNRILAAFSPNKTFLMLDIADYERMKELGEWSRYHFLYFPTYVSAKAWVEFSDWLARHEGNVSTFLSRVGFKNFHIVLKKVKKWWFDNITAPTIRITAQLGGEMTLNRGRDLRILSMEEESGGRTAGFAEPIMNIIGDRSFSLPEKAVPDALLSHLYFMARRYNQVPSRKISMRLPYILKTFFQRYAIRSKVDYRVDVPHGDPGVIGLLPFEEVELEENKCFANKQNFNNFFFSVAKAVRDNKISIEQAKTILTLIVPEWQETWECMNKIVFVEEELRPGETRPEGVMMTFSPRDGLTPLVTSFKFRPSGTDKLKSKVYLDAERLTPAQIDEIEHTFKEELPKMDLTAVLDHFGIEYADEIPAEFAIIRPDLRKYEDLPATL